MRLLLDTDTLLLWLIDSPRLSHTARLVMGDPANELLWSAVSTWELAERIRLGTTRIPGPLDQFVPRVLREQTLTPLPMHHAHACRLVRLPLDADPFDAALVAQALVEGLPVVSWDARLAALGAELVW